MKQREVQDAISVKWQCSQAFSGIEGKASEKASAYIEDNHDKVSVVCTPSGASQTVRLMLDKEWDEKMSDDELLRAIAAARH